LEQRRARGGVNTQRPQREARTVLRPSSWSTQDLPVGVVGSAVVVVGFKFGEPRVGSGAASHSFAVVLHEAVREAPAEPGS
jgi:hypothetical protein